MIIDITFRKSFIKKVIREFINDKRIFIEQENQK